MAKTFLRIKIKSQPRKRGKKQISEITYKTANSNVKSHIWQKYLPWHKDKKSNKKKKQNCRSENNKLSENWLPRDYWA